MRTQKPLISILFYAFSVGLCLLAAACAAPPVKKTVQHISNWNQLSNPVLSIQNEQVTDVDAIYDKGTWYLFYSVLYEDSTGKHARIIEVSTTDFKQYSKPILFFNGQEDGWQGMANPDITRHRNIYYLSFNSWGSKPGTPDQLFYMTSRDLKSWTVKTALAPELTTGGKATHPSLAFSRGKAFLIYHQEKEPQVAMAKGVRTPFEKLGIGTPSFYSSTDTIVPHTRHQLIRFGNKWGLLASGNNQLPYLYMLPVQGASGLGWLTWEGGYPLKVYRREVGAVAPPESATLVNMQRFGGYFYLFYVMNPGNATTQEIGSSHIEVYRSTDLINWAPAGR